MVSVISFELVPSEPNGEVQENVQSAEFEVFENLDEIENAENISSSAELGVSDMTTTTEMCERLKRLLQENVDLKDKLQRNNQVMHEQLNIIATWRDQIAQTNTKHRTMLEDLVWQNQKLQDEKAALEKRVDELEKASNSCEQCDVYKGEHSDLEEKLAQILNEKKNLDDELKKSKQALENAVSRLLPSNFKFEDSASSKSEGSSSLATIVTDEESDYAIIIKEDFPVYKSDDAAALKNIATQCEQLQLQVSELSQKLSEEEKKSENLKKFLEERTQESETLQLENLELKSQNMESLSIISGFNHERTSLTDLKELEIKMATISQERDEEKIKCENAKMTFVEKDQKLEELEITNSELKNQNIELLSTISLLKDDLRKLSCMVQALQSFRDKCETLEDQVQTYKTKLMDLQYIKCEKEHKIEKLQKEIKLSAEDLKNEQIQNELHKKSLIAAEQNFMQLYEEQQRMVKLAMEQKQDIQIQCQKMTSVEATEKAEHQNQLDSLTAKLLHMEERLHAEEEKAGYLKREVKTLTEDSECIPILKAQVEIYKTELETEKKTRDDGALRELTLTHEVNDLKEQIKNLQEMIANQPHLQHRGSGRHYKAPRFAFSSKHSREISSSERPILEAPRSTSIGSAEESIQKYSCPCCPLSFTDLNAVQNHVERCLAESSS